MRTEKLWQNERHLSRRQLIILDDLFNSDLDEQGVFDKHKVRRSTYERWLAEELFAERFNQIREQRKAAKRAFNGQIQLSCGGEIGRIDHI